MFCLFLVLIVGLGSVNSETPIIVATGSDILADEASDTSGIDELVEGFEGLKGEVKLLEGEVKRLDMLIKFYHPEWTWTSARECGKSCPYLVNLLDFAAVQWQFSGKMDGKFDLEFVNENGGMRGNMDFYGRHMWLRGCGWVTYDKEASEVDGPRTWSFAKSADGFKLYAEEELLLDYTYVSGRCADLWSGPTAGFYFETPATAVHLLQHGMDMFWWNNV